MYLVIEMEITCLKRWWEGYVFLARSLQTAANERMLISSCLSVRSHVTSRKTSEFISEKFIYGNFTEPCFDNSQSTRRNLPEHLNPQKNYNINFKTRL